MKLVIFLADGFEEVEALTVVDYLRRMDVAIDMVSITDNLEVIGAHDIKVIVDKLIKDVKSDNYTGLVIPGGMPGASNLRDNKEVIEIVKMMHKNNKMVAAICAGPIVLQKAGILEDKNVTSFPGFENELKDSNYKTDAVVVDSNIITAQGPNFARDFAIEIIRYLLNDDKVKALKSEILYND